LRRDRETSSLVSSGQSPKGRRIEGRGVQGRGGKKWFRRAWFISSRDEAPGRLWKRGVGVPAAIFFTDQIERGVAEARRGFQWAFFAALMALKEPCVERWTAALSRGRTRNESGGRQSGTRAGELRGWETTRAWISRRFS